MPNVGTSSLYDIPDYTAGLGLGSGLGGLGLDQSDNLGLGLGGLGLGSGVPTATTASSLTTDHFLKQSSLPDVAPTTQPVQPAGSAASLLVTDALLSLPMPGVSGSVGDPPMYTTGGCVFPPNSIGA